MGIKEIEIGDKKLTLHENDVVYDPSTGRPLTGSWIWDSSRILSQFLFASNFDFRGKSVIELGAGLGLPGLTAASLGASRVVLIDVAPLLGALRRNVEANRLGDRVEVRELAWGSSEAALQEERKYEVVLMSDVFLEAEEMVALGEMVRRVSGEETVVLAATEVRFWTFECFNELVNQGIGVVELTTGLGGGGDGGDTYVIYRLIPLGNEGCHVENVEASTRLFQGQLNLI